MGIKNINPYLKKKCPDAYFTMDLKQLSGYRIAIDSSNCMYITMARAHKSVLAKHDLAKGLPDKNIILREWFKQILQFILVFLDYQITPIFILDGIAPVAKNNTQLERRKEKEKRKNKISKLSDTIYSIKDVMKRDTELINELRKLLANDTSLDAEDYQFFEEFLLQIGIPVIKANGEAERLCATLCNLKYVAAVYSTDTDNHCHGCPLRISKMNYRMVGDTYKATIDCVRHDKILEGLKMKQASFVDFAIMCGCDYNTNIPGIGPSKSHKMILDHKYVDRMELKKKQLKVLDLWTCRFQFATQKMNYLSDGKMTDELLKLRNDNFENIRETLSTFKIDGLCVRFVNAYKKSLDSKAGIPESIDIGYIDRYRFRARKIRI